VAEAAGEADAVGDADAAAEADAVGDALAVGTGVSTFWHEATKAERAIRERIDFFMWWPS
jgi:hypothetical protein